MATLRWSYVHGASLEPLLGATIGGVFDQTAERLPAHEFSRAVLWAR